MLRYLLSFLVAALAAILYAPISRNVTVLGLSRGTLTSPVRAQGDGFYRIEDTMQCEDLHYHAPSGKIFAACEDSILPRFEWFPPLGTFKGAAQTTGSIHVIDPETMKSTRLQFENFPGPFITHGFDIAADPAHPSAVYILAVNHLANPSYEPDSDLSKARSQIELFHHVLGTSTARFVRSIRHPLIVTPNDIYAVSPDSFYVTNDHAYRDGPLRLVEDLVPYIGWTTTVHIQLDSLASSASAEDGVTAHTALTGLKNNNGLGHGASPDEVLITSAIGGVLYRASASPSNQSVLAVNEAIPVDSTIDNPSYYRDPEATADHDASGYVLAGLRRGADLPRTVHDPQGKEGVVVWLVRKTGKADAPAWEQRLLFEDDGTNLRSASAAVLVPAASEAGTKKAWLFVSGFISESVVAVEVDL